MAETEVLSNLRAELEKERSVVAHQLEELTADEESSFDGNFADSGQVAAEKGEVRTHEASLQDQLTEIDHALAKFDEGSYGKCERCGQQIGEARLEAMPATRWCINCA